uniref:Uncharacterized protein n=1 Tax=Peronospora matthiolae TaxID=2874970 RepID=A0AAV1TTD3_9STRA
MAWLGGIAAQLWHRCIISRDVQSLRTTKNFVVAIEWQTERESGSLLLNTQAKSSAALIYLDAPMCTHNLIARLMHVECLTKESLVHNYRRAARSCYVSSALSNIPSPVVTRSLPTTCRGDCEVLLPSLEKRFIVVTSYSRGGGSSAIHGYHNASRRLCVTY